MVGCGSADSCQLGLTKVFLKSKTYEALQFAKLKIQDNFADIAIRFCAKNLKKYLQLIGPYFRMIQLIQATFRMHLQYSKCIWLRYAVVCMQEKFRANKARSLRIKQFQEAVLSYGVRYTMASMIDVLAMDEEEEEAENRRAIEINEQKTSSGKLVQTLADAKLKAMMSAATPSRSVKLGSDSSVRADDRRATRTPARERAAARESE